MTFPISPGVYSEEFDKSATPPSLSSSIGGFVGNFRWGPVEQALLYSSEADIISRTGKPRLQDNDFFFASQFLAYTNALRIIRVTGLGAANANSGSYSSPSSGSGDGTNTLFVKNDADYADGFVIPVDLVNADYIAAFPGEFGNNITVYVCPTAAAFNSVGFSNYKNSFTKAPGTSIYAQGFGKTNDEMHIVVVDATGGISGIAGSILETFAFVSQASDAKLPEGASNYYADVVNRSSNYIRFGQTDSRLNFAGIAVMDMTSVSYAATTAIIAPLTYVFNGGADGATLVDADYIRGYELFADPESSDISLLPVGNVSDVVKQYVVQNIAEVRKDTFVTISPKFESVVGNSGDELTAVLADRESVNLNSSYVAMDCNWKYIYDKYNDRRLWVPCSADVAGLCANTDRVAAPWFSPAGINRGILKNVIKLAWNPKETQRDSLYSNEINPIINKLGTGVVLFGDKTMQRRESAFSRINVRRLFIVVEKTIGITSQTFLFEQNTPITRSLFVSTVEPYLREIQGRQGITEFTIVADEKINTPLVIDRNEFLAEIYITPAKSINYIKLSFVVTRTGANVTEFIGTL